MNNKKIKQTKWVLFYSYWFLKKFLLQHIKKITNQFITYINININNYKLKEIK